MESRIFKEYYPVTVFIALFGLCFFLFLFSGLARTLEGFLTLSFVVLFFIILSTFFWKLTVQVTENDIIVSKGIYSYLLAGKKIPISSIKSIKKVNWRPFRELFTTFHHRPIEVQVNDFDWGAFSLRPNNNSDIEIIYDENGKEKTYHLAVKDAELLMKYFREHIDSSRISIVS